MRFNKILITLKKELNTIIRDKKSLAMMFIMPLFIPIFIFLMSFMYENMTSSLEETVYNVGINYELNSNEKEIINQTSLKVINYENQEQLQDAFEAKQINAYINKEESKYIVSFNPDEQDSSVAGSMLNSYLETYNKFLAQNYLIGQDIEPAEVFNILSIEHQELEGDNTFIQEILSMGLTYALLAIITTAVYCATDIIAGEKERGTLETLLTFPIKSSELITGKYLAIFISCVITSFLSLILCFSSLKIASNMFELYKTISLNIGIPTILISIVTLIFASLIASGLTIAIACYCKSYKEAQEALTPISFVSIIPMFLPMAGVETNAILSIIPIVNHGVLLNDIVSNSVKSSNVILMIISSIICTIGIIFFISKQYKSERVLFS